MSGHGWVHVAPAGANRWTVRLSGEFDGHESAELRQALGDVATTHGSIIDVEMHSVTFLGAAAVAAIEAAVSSAMSSGAVLRVTSASPIVIRVLEATRLRHILHVPPTPRSESPA